MPKEVDINPVSQRPRMEHPKSGWHDYDEAKAAEAAKQQKKELQNQHRQLIVLATIEILSWFFIPVKILPTTRSYHLQQIT